MITVTKKFELSYAHILPGHTGKCHNLHGHNAVVEVTIMGEIITDPNSSEGMVLDFGDLKKIVGPIIDKWDHKFLAKGDEWVVEAANLYLQQAPSPDFLDDFDVGPQPQIVQVGFRTTAENFALYIYRVVQSHLVKYKPSCSVLEVKFWETPNSCATVDSEPDEEPF